MADRFNVGNVKTVSSKIVWEISDFCTCCENIGDRVISAKFVASSVSNDVMWNLVLYPRGGTPDCNDFLSLYLFTSKKIKATIELKILSNKGEVVANYTMEDDTFDSQTLNGTKELISRDFIVNPVNGILNKGKLTIVCEITKPTYKVKEIKPKELEQETAVLPRLAVLDIYEVLLTDSKFSDVSLMSEGKAVKAHKCILANSSPVFAAMFDAEMKEKRENTVEIDDIKYDVLLEMVRFVYAGKVNNIDALVGELATAADKYALDGLKAKCEMTMTKNLSADNVIDCLQLADKLRMDTLKEKAIEFIVEKGKVVTRKPEFESLPSEIMCKICRLLSEKSK